MHQNVQGQSEGWPMSPWFQLKIVFIVFFTVLYIFGFFIFAASYVLNNQMQTENRQANTLFGVVGLFFVGHIFRICQNLHEAFGSFEESPTDQKGHDQLQSNVSNTTGETFDPNEMCALMMPFWLLVKWPLMPTFYILFSVIYENFRY